MWSKTFDQRLGAWYNLRLHTQNLPLTDCLHAINTWWFNSPWQPYYLHWDDQLTWPDPWQLLSDNVYCEVARGLGILYTISLLDRRDIESADLVLTESGHNLVLVNQPKYILNWEPSTVLNNNLDTTTKQRLTHYQIKQQYN
jgi:hypothetical protein